jgi:hypothetical protein
VSGFILLPEKKLEFLLDKIEAVLEFSRKAAANTVRTGDWISEGEAQKLLGLKETSLWSLRKRKQIASSKIGSKTFYSIKSIEKLLSKNQE